MKVIQVGNNIAQMDSLRKKASYLQVMLKEEIEKREEAQSKLKEYRERSLRTEQEFKRVLQKYDGNIAILNGRQTYSQNIWNKLIGEIQNFNDNSEKMLDKRCDEILRIMERKINQIIQKTDAQIKKNKKLSEEEYKSIKAEVKEALHIARHIEEQNQKTKKDNRELQFKVNILREEKKLLVEELNQKKLLILKIKKQYIDPMESSVMSVRPRSVKNAFENSRTPKYVGEPSLKMSSISVQNPEIRSRPAQSPQAKDRGSMLMRTENHLKICMEREKRKNAELKGVIGRFQTKYKEINVLIDKSLKEIDKDGLIQTRMRNLEKIIEDVKLRLVLTISPPKEVSIGLSQEEISDILKY